MSNTIDTNVVAMKFDNSNFENNVKQSMSTLDKLKQKLNLSGASKGLQALRAPPMLLLVCRLLKVAFLSIRLS